MKLREFIQAVISECLSESSQYNKLVFVKKDGVDKIRAKNARLNQLLYNDVFKNKNIYLKGGVARMALETYLYGGSETVIRDIDYCYIGEYKDYDKLDLEEHVDYEGKTIDGYFKNRDITLNEVLLNPHSLIFTRRAHRDFYNNKINSKKIFIDSRLYSRMLLFSVRYDYTINDSVNTYFNKKVEVNDFDFLVCLLKAYEIGKEHDYYYVCNKNNITRCESLSEWIIDLLTSVYDFDLYGREKYIAKDVLQYNKLEELYKTYPELQKEVERIGFDDMDFSQYMKKRNRVNYPPTP